MKYTHLISNLEKLIENWYDKEYLYKVIKEPRDGLCDNIKKISVVEIPCECFESWEYFSGDSSYPVDGKVEYSNGCSAPYTLFNNPKRLHLAVHMLIWLRQNNCSDEII